VIIRIAENMLFDVFVLSGVVIVFEPHGHGEISRQIVRHDFRRNSHACCSVKHENLATTTKKKIKLLYIMLSRHVTIKSNVERNKSAD
jgi:hypothetical protein